MYVDSIDTGSYKWHHKHKELRWSISPDKMILCGDDRVDFN